MNLLIQAVILKNFLSDFSIVAAIISLMALDSAFGPMAGWRVHNQIFESQSGPFY